MTGATGGGAKKGGRKPGTAAKKTPGRKPGTAAKKTTGRRPGGRPRAR